jgi:toxin YhaV
MLVNGWRLYQHTLFQEQLAKLSAEVQRLAFSQPTTYREHPKTKLLATVLRYVTELIPRDPGSIEFRQGNTLGPDNRHWFRAKFHRRYRLFFRFSSREKIIVYVWLNDELTLRKSGSKTDPYAVFKSMLASGNPPHFLDDLLRKSEEVS